MLNRSDVSTEGGHRHVPYQRSFSGSGMMHLPENQQGSEQNAMDRVAPTNLSALSSCDQLACCVSCAPALLANLTNSSIRNGQPQHASSSPHVNAGTTNIAQPPISHMTSSKHTALMMHHRGTCQTFLMQLPTATWFQTRVDFESPLGRLRHGAAAAKPRGPKTGRANRANPPAPSHDRPPPVPLTLRTDTVPLKPVACDAAVGHNAFPTLVSRRSTTCIPRACNAYTSGPSMHNGCWEAGLLVQLVRGPSRFALESKRTHGALHNSAVPVVVVVCPGVHRHEL